MMVHDMEVKVRFPQGSAPNNGALWPNDTHTHMLESGESATADRNSLFTEDPIYVSILLTITIQMISRFLTSKKFLNGRALLDPTEHFRMYVGRGGT